MVPGHHSRRGRHEGAPGEHRGGPRGPGHSSELVAERRPVEGHVAALVEQDALAGRLQDRVVVGAFENPV